MSDPTFGTDISTFPDLDPTFTPISGPQVVAERIARRFLTEEGTLVEDPNFGFGVLNLLNAEIDSADAERIRRRMAEEVLKDESVEACEVRLEAPPAGTAQALRVRVKFTTADGPFSFVLPIDDVTTAIVVSPEL